ncbi:MAG: HPF/RaiA family ribosome-associated protein [Candidatus Moraniibacteriota bacterium]
MVLINYRFNSDLAKEEKIKLKNYLASKIAKWEKLFKNMDFPPKVNVEVEFLPKKKRYRVEIQLNSAIGRLIGACEKQNWNEGVDEVVEDVRCQFRKQKDKMLTLRRRAGMSIKKLFSVHKTARFRLPGWLKSRFHKK